MVALSLKIGVGNVVKTMQFEPSTVVYDACRIIRERVPEAQLGQRESHTRTRTHARCRPCRVMSAYANLRSSSSACCDLSASTPELRLQQLLWPQVKTRWQRSGRLLRNLA